MERNTWIRPAHCPGSSSRPIDVEFEKTMEEMTIAETGREDSGLRSTTIGSMSTQQPLQQTSRAGELVNIRSRERKAGEKRPNSKFIYQQMSGMDGRDTPKGPRVTSQPMDSQSRATTSKSNVTLVGSSSSSAPTQAHSSVQHYLATLGASSRSSASSSRYNSGKTSANVNRNGPVGVGQDAPNEDRGNGAAAEGSDFDEGNRHADAASHTAKWIYKTVITSLIKFDIEPLIIPAILEDTSTTRSMAVRPEAGTTPLQTLLKKLDSIFHNCVNFDPRVNQKLFRQLYYYISAESLNNLLEKDKLCDWKNGIKIRSNISKLEAWSIEKEMDRKVVNAALEPIIQASEVLQHDKSEENVNDLCRMCGKLTTSQIVRLVLNMPLGQFEGKRRKSVAKLVEDRLIEIRGRSESERNLLLDTSFIFPDQLTFDAN